MEKLKSLIITGDLYDPRSTGLHQVLFVMLLCHMRSSFNMPLLYRALILTGRYMYEKKQSFIPEKLL